MNEQQLADLFSEQIDRMLAGKPGLNSPPVGDLPEIVRLGQQLLQANFQASPAAQLAFQSQIATWFGATGNGVSATTLATSKSLWIGLGATVMAIGAGIGLMALIASILIGVVLPNDGQSGPRATILPVSAPLKVTGLPAPAAPEVNETPTDAPEATGTPVLATPPPIAPDVTSSLGDTIPPATSSMGDTLPSTTPPVRPTAAERPANTDDGHSDGGDTGQENTDDNTPEASDHDRGHGNDLDGYDEDNPGKSDGLPGESGGGDPGDGHDQGQGGGSGSGGHGGGGSKH